MKLRARFENERVAKPTTTRPAPKARPADDDVSPAARNLALAHYLSRLIDQGILSDYAQAAQALGVSQPRVTHLMSLLLLSPEIQERVLFGELELREKELRRLGRVDEWGEQTRPMEQHRHRTPSNQPAR